MATDGGGIFVWTKNDLVYGEAIRRPGDECDMW